MYTQEKNKYKEWEVEFSFHIYGRNPVGGNGLAFWYTKNQVKLGNVFGANDHWNGLGLFFDTYDPTGNRNMPYIMAIVNDGSKGFNDLKGQSSSVAGACYRAVRNALDAVYVKVSYTSDEKLSVDIDFTKEGERYENCFTATNVKLPSDNYFGVSAESGEYADDHELVSFETFELNPKAKENIKARYKAHPEDFKLSDEQKKHIKDAEKKVDKIKHKDDKPSNTPYQPTVEGEAKLINTIRETQYKIIESLDNLHTRLGSSSGSNNVVSSDSPGSKHISDKVDEIANKVNVLTAELKVMTEALTLITQQLSNGLSPSRDAAGVQDAINDIKSRLNNIDSRTLSQHQTVTSHLEKQTQQLTSQPGTPFWQYLFWMVITQLFITVGYNLYRKRTDKDDKKFI